jgi:hypothetical protein
MREVLDARGLSPKFGRGERRFEGGTVYLSYRTNRTR